VLFSLIVPTYNCANFIDRLVDNLVDIKRQIEVELVICDDASTDGTYDSLLADERLAGAIIIKNETNMGVSYTRNRAVSISTGSFLVFQDCDDISLVGRFQVHKEHLSKSDSLSYVSSKKIYSHLTRDIFMENVDNAKVSIRNLSRFIFLGEEITNLPSGAWPSSCLAVRRSCFVETGGFRENFRRLEDVDFLMRAVQKGFGISGSSTIGVVRFDVAGEHNSAFSNLTGELQLLENYSCDHLSRREILYSKCWLIARANYFRQKFAKAAFFFGFSLLLSPIHAARRSLKRLPGRLAFDQSVRSTEGRRL